MKHPNPSFRSRLSAVIQWTLVFCSLVHANSWAADSTQLNRIEMRVVEQNATSPIHPGAGGNPAEIRLERFGDLFSPASIFVSLNPFLPSARIQLRSSQPLENVRTGVIIDLPAHVKVATLWIDHLYTDLQEPPIRLEVGSQWMPGTGITSAPVVVKLVSAPVTNQSPRFEARLEGSDSRQIPSVPFNDSADGFAWIRVTAFDPDGRPVKAWSADYESTVGLFPPVQPGEEATTFFKLDLSRHAGREELVSPVIIVEDNAGEQKAITFSKLFRTLGGYEFSIAVDFENEHRQVPTKTRIRIDRARPLSATNEYVVEIAGGSQRVFQHRVASTNDHEEIELELTDPGAYSVRLIDGPRQDALRPVIPTSMEFHLFGENDAPSVTLVQTSLQLTRGQSDWVTLRRLGRIDTASRISLIPIENSTGQNPVPFPRRTRHSAVLGTDFQISSRSIDFPAGTREAKVLLSALWANSVRGNMGTEIIVRAITNAQSAASVPLSLVILDPRVPAPGSLHIESIGDAGSGMVDLRFVANGLSKVTSMTLRDETRTLMTTNRFLDGLQFQPLASGRQRLVASITDEWNRQVDSKPVDVLVSATATLHPDPGSTRHRWMEFGITPRLVSVEVSTNLVDWETVVPRAGISVLPILNVSPRWIRVPQLDASGTFYRIRNWEW